MENWKAIVRWKESIHFLNPTADIHFLSCSSSSTSPLYRLHQTILFLQLLSIPFQPRQILVLISGKIPSPLLHILLHHFWDYRHDSCLRSSSFKTIKFIQLLIVDPSKCFISFVIVFIAQIISVMVSFRWPLIINCFYFCSQLKVRVLSKGLMIFRRFIS